jgi:hypothetical protein
MPCAKCCCFSALMPQRRSASPPSNSSRSRSKRGFGIDRSRERYSTEQAWAAYESRSGYIAGVTIRRLMRVRRGSSIQTLTAVVGGKALKSSSHRIDFEDVRGNEMVPASFGSVHLEVTSCICGGGASAAEMNEGSKISPLPLVNRYVARPGEDSSNVPVQIYRCQLDGMAGYDADIGAETTTSIFDRSCSDAETCDLGIGRIGHLE